MNSNKDQNVKNRVVITIDGPAGAGKSSVAKTVAKSLDIPHLDSGSYYRMVTLAALERNIDLGDKEAIKQLVEHLSFDHQMGHAILDGKDVETEIRSEEITSKVYLIAQNEQVREQLLTPMRQELAASGGVIDGRDAATKIAPNADIRIWLDADIVERAKRRAKESGEEDRIQWYIKDLQRRDDADKKQMVRHVDAIGIDSTDMTFQEVVETILKIVADETGTMGSYPSSLGDKHA